MTTQLVDQVLMCAECQGDFAFTADEQRFFLDKGFKNAPRRCKPCRAKRAKKPIPEIKETAVNCAECGLTSTVPFVPSRHRPVYCRDCYSSRKKSA